VSGVYWGLTAMDLMGQLHRMDQEQVLEFIMACHSDADGGFAPALHHDSHLIYTLSAVQVDVDLVIDVALVAIHPAGRGIGAI